MTELEQVLMKRDNMSLAEVRQLISDARKDIWEYGSKQDRFIEVRGAIYRYLNDGKSLNLDWINEYNELSKYLEMYNKEIVDTCAIPITEEDLNQ